MKRIFNYIFSFIKELLNKVSLSKRTKDIDLALLKRYIPAIDEEQSLKLFEEIRIGDIVYAPTYYKEASLRVIPKSHRQRPFLVVKKEKNYLLGFFGTSNQNKKYNLSFDLYKSSYQVSKDGIINLGKLSFIDSRAIINIADHLTVADMLKINLAISNSNLIKKTKFELNLQLTPGMIISAFKKLFLVYKVDETTTILYQLTENDSDTIKIPFNGKIYFIDVKNQMILNKHFKYTVLDANKINVLKEIDYKLNPVKNISKINKQNRFEMTHYFKHKVGQVYVLGMRTFVYLFSCNKEDYAIEIYDDEEISPITRIEQYEEYLIEYGMLEKDEIIDVVSETAERNSKCKWLYDFVLNNQSI